MSTGTGRVTAGLPALDPSVRFQAHTVEVKQDRDSRIHAELEAKRDAAIAPDGDRDRTDKQACIGIPLQAESIIGRLTQLNPSLIFKKHPILNRFQICVRDSQAENGERYICSFESGVSSEFDILLWHYEEHVKGHGKDARLEKVKVADSTVCGWASRLVKLIDEKLITRAGAERLFGTIHSYSWQQRTQGH
jgi:hypothetical protein